MVAKYKQHGYWWKIAKMMRRQFVSLRSKGMVDTSMLLNSTGSLPKTSSYAKYIYALKSDIQRDGKLASIVGGRVYVIPKAKQHEYMRRLDRASAWALQVSAMLQSRMQEKLRQQRRKGVDRDRLLQAIRKHVPAGQEEQALKTILELLEE